MSHSLCQCLPQIFADNDNYGAAEIPGSAVIQVLQEVWSGGERYSQTLCLLLLPVLPAHPLPWSAPTSNPTSDIHSILQAGAPQPLHCSRAPSHPRVLPIVSISLPTCLPKYRQRRTSESISGLWSPAAQQMSAWKSNFKQFQKNQFPAPAVCRPHSHL